LLILSFLLVGIIAFPGISLAVPPVVKTVPWVATNPLIPHDTWSGKTITLKGTSDVQGASIQYTWDFGDGSPVLTGTVTNRYVIEAAHAYTAPEGTIFTARLTVTDTGTGEFGSKVYFVAVQAQSLEVEVNVAIDEGLWYLHKTQDRYTSGGSDYGRWISGYAGATGSAYYCVTAANVNAFEANGHLESGDQSNPYVETVKRGMRQVFAYLQTIAISPQPAGDPDSNGNGYGVQVAGTYPPYQGGMFIDAIVASGDPDAVTTTGQAPSGGNPGILGRTYQDIVQDMVDAHAWGQVENSVWRGGWRYQWNYSTSDNSICQWAAIGLLAAERTPAHIDPGPDGILGTADDLVIDYWAAVPGWVKTENELWLNYSQNSSTGWFGYTDQNPIWGPYATTPSGMVQLIMDGLGRGDFGWDKAETFMRDTFCNTGGAGNAIRDYYYGLFSFVKSMILHIPGPIQFLQSQTSGVVPIDWYNAEVSQGDPCDGVARTLVNDQNAAGFWYGHDADSRQYVLDTAWAIIMLNRTIFLAGAPVAVAEATPNPGLVGEAITLDGSGSFHQDPTKSIDSWEWDLDNDGVFDETGPVVTTSFPALGSFIVTLRVTDDASPEAEDTTILSVQITTPPVPPTADAGGRYVFCPQTQPWFLDGTGSVNPDEGVSLPGAPGDTIQQYAWELDGFDNDFDEAFGPQPDVTAFFTALGLGSYLIQLRVTDTTASSFPGLDPPFDQDLSDTDSAQVFVKDADDPACTGCVDDLFARPKSGKVEVTWTHTGAVSYNVYRGTSAGGPYMFIANTTSTYAVYMDTGLTNGTTYYYVVREVALNTNELCQSNEASATPTARLRTR